MARHRSELFWIASIGILSLVCLGRSWAGTGQVVSGSPSYVNLNLYYTYTPTDMAVMKKAFEEASRLLFNSTNGQLRYGTIRVSANSAFQDKADVWVNSGAQGAYALPAGLGTAGAHITLYENRHKWTNEDGPDGNERGQFGIVHEFGHGGRQQQRLADQPAQVPQERRLRQDHARHQPDRQRHPGAGGG